MTARVAAAACGAVLTRRPRRHRRGEAAGGLPRRTRRDGQRVRPRRRVRTHLVRVPTARPRRLRRARRRPAPGVCRPRRSPRRRRRPVTFALATRVLDDPHWSAIGPGRPLRGARLVEVGDGPLPDAPITVAERVLHHVMGCGQLDGELARTATVLPPPSTAPCHAAMAEQLVGVWSDPAMPLVHLVGHRLADCRDVAAAAAAHVGAVAYRVRVADLPSDPTARADLARRWRRELVLAATVLVIDAGTELPSGQSASELAGFLDHLAGPVAVVGGSGAIPTVSPWHRLEVPVPEGDEARALWERRLGTKARSLRRHVDRAVDQFRLGAAEITEVADDVARANGSAARVLWDGCRARTRPVLDGLVQRVDSAATWEDLVLPRGERETLQAIVRHAEQRGSVARAWGVPPRRPWQRDHRVVPRSERNGQDAGRRGRRRRRSASTSIGSTSARSSASTSARPRRTSADLRRRRRRRCRAAVRRGRRPVRKAHRGA